MRQPTPLAWLVGQAEVLEEGGDPLRARLNEPSFDPLQVVLLDEARPVAGQPVAGTVTIEARAPGLLRLRTTAPADTILVVAEPYSRGWQATLDGVATKVRRGNLVNLAVPVVAGEHLVELRYEQRGWREGVALSLVALAMIGVGVVRGFGVPLLGRRSQHGV